MREKPLDHVHRPARCQPRVLVEEISPVFALMLVHLRAEPHVALCLFHAQLEFLQPNVAVTIHELVELLQSGEHGTRGRADDQQRFIANNRFPTSCPVCQLIEVVPILDVHGLPRSQSGRLANLGDARRAEYLADISTAQLRIETLHGVAADRHVDACIGIDFMQRLAQHCFGQDKLVLLSQSRGLWIIFNNRSRAAYYLGEPRGRVAHSRGGEHPTFNWRVPRTGRPCQIVNVNAFLRLIKDDLLEARLIIVSVHLPCHCSPLGRRPSRWRSDASIATGLRPISQNKLIGQSGRSA